MRVNRYVALATGVSRRAADLLIGQSRVLVDGQPALMGQSVPSSAQVTLDGQRLTLANLTTVALHKPVGYVSSRQGQGSRTIYDLLPAELHHLKPVGRLDKDSSGLLLLTNDGQQAQLLSHPSSQKTKIYEVEVDKPLSAVDQSHIERGVKLDDGLSALALTGQGRRWVITLHEGRNRQIRRTFGHMGYEVTRLHRTAFGPYTLGPLQSGKYRFL